MNTRTKTSIGKFLKMKAVDTVGPKNSNQI